MTTYLPGDLIKRKIFRVEDRKPPGSDGGTYTPANAAVTRLLNTVVRNDIPGASLDVNGGGANISRFTLPAGEYILNVSTSAYSVGYCSAWIANITDNIEYFRSTDPEYSASSATVKLRINHRTFTITKPTTFELRFRSTDARSSNGLGVGALVNYLPFNRFSTITVEKIG